MKKIIFTALSLALFVSNIFANSNANMRSKVLNIATSSATTLCSSKAYTTCYGVNTKKCIATIKPMIKTCFRRYESSIFNSSSSKHLSLVGNKIGQCAGNMYHEKLAHKADKQCLQNESAKLR